MQVPCPDHPDKLINAGKNHPKRCKCKKAQNIRMEHTLSTTEKARAIKHINENPADKGKVESLKYLKGRNKNRAKFYIQARANHLAHLARKEEARLRREAKETEMIMEGELPPRIIDNEIAQKLIEAVGGIPKINKSGNLKIVVNTTDPRAKNATKLISIKEALELGQGS